jgi:hypothetical protein
MREALEAASRSMSGGLAAEYLKATDKGSPASTIGGSVSRFHLENSESISNVARLAERRLQRKGVGEALGSRAGSLAEQALRSSLSESTLEFHQLAAKALPCLRSGAMVDARSITAPRPGAISAAFLTGNYSSIARMVEDHLRPTASLAAVALSQHFTSADIRRPQPLAARLLELRAQGLGPRRTFDLNNPPAVVQQLRGVTAEPASPPAPRTRDPHPAPARRAPRRPDHEVAPVAAGYLAERDRRIVIGFFDAAGLARERAHFEACEERMRAGHEPARAHVAVSARKLLEGVADHFFPARSELYVCRFNCPHKVGAEQVANRVSAFVDQRLRQHLDPHEHKHFQATLEWVYRWGGRGTHENCSSEEVAKGFLRLLEVLGVVARAYGVKLS